MKEQILKIKQENPAFGYQQIANIVGCSKNAVKYHLTSQNKKKNQVRRNKNRKHLIKELKMLYGGKCSICGYNKCQDALHFHHTNPENKNGSVRQILYSKSKKMAYEEAKQCILICANCHAELHFEINGRSGGNCTHKTTDFKSGYCADS